MKNFFLVFFALGLLSGCSIVKDTIDPAEVPLEESVKDWLHEQNGQVLTFRNAAGTTQTVLVRRRNESTTGAAAKVSTARVKVESVTLTYSRLPVKLDSVSMVANQKNQLQFFYTGLPAGTTSDGRYLLTTLYTSSDHSQDLTDPTAAMLTNYTLGSRTYANVVMIKQLGYWKGLTVPTALDDLYYSRTDGLVGFRTLDGQLWTRP